MSVWNKVLRGIRINGRPHIKVYRGFGGAEQLEIFGHVLDRGPLPERLYSRFILYNMLALIRMFMVKPRAHATVKLVWEGVAVETVTDTDGFFHLQWQPAVMPEAGWHEVEVELLGVADSRDNRVKGVVFIPHRSQFGCISDIDDTFLVSHSATVFKRLYTLLTRNAHTRKPFDGVVRHYRLLSNTESADNIPNPFFYVSSSEWNLYAYILEFCNRHGLPEGVYLLSQIKPLHLLLKSGQQKHATKFTRISRILKSYPHMRFILLGDDTQEDPHIYQALTEHFAPQIIAIYFRHIRKSRYAIVQQVAADISAKGIPCCYFRHSEDAIAHSQHIGLIS